MQDFEKCIVELKSKIRIALNESGLQYSIALGALDGIKAEMLQTALTELALSVINPEKEVPEANELHENSVGE